MKPRRKPVALRKPTNFPEENVAERWDARHLLGHTEFEAYRFVKLRFQRRKFQRPPLHRLLV